MATSSWSLNTPMVVSDTPTTLIIVTTVSFEKRVRKSDSPSQRICSSPSYIVWVGPLVVKELKRIVEASEITKWVVHRRSAEMRADDDSFHHREDDTNWPKKNIVGKQELEIRVGNDHIAFEVCPLPQYPLCVSLHSPFRRLRRLDRWLTFRTAKTQKGSACSTISCKTWR